MRDPFLMIYADYEEWYRITFSQAPLLASHEHLQIRNKARSQTWLRCFPPPVSRSTHTYTHLFIWVSLLSFSFYDSQKKEKKKKSRAQSFSHAGTRDDTQISDSTETKWNDLDISLCQNASGLFSQLKYETDRWEGEGKTKIDVFWGGTDAIYMNKKKKRRCYRAIPTHLKAPYYAKFVLWMVSNSNMQI